MKKWTNSITASARQLLWDYLAENLALDLSEIGWQRGLQGFNSNNLAYKLRLNQGTNGLTRHEQAFICGIVLEGGTDIVSQFDMS